MPNNNLATLEKHIYNSIPRLRELSSGCILENKANLKRYEIAIYLGESFCILDNKRKYPLTVNSKIRDYYNIIGHPILLNDVLEWIHKEIMKGSTVVSTHAISVIINWNLPKPALKDQSQELIDALTELIPK